MTRRIRWRYLSATYQSAVLPSGPWLQVAPSISISDFRLGPNRGRRFFDLTLDVYAASRTWHFNVRVHRARLARRVRAVGE